MNRITVLFVAMLVLTVTALADQHTHSVGLVPRTAVTDNVTPAPPGPTPDATTGYSWGLSISTFTFGWNSVNLATGGVTDITTGSSDFYSGGDYDAAGTFYAFDFYNNMLVTINQGTGAVTVVGAVAPAGAAGVDVWEGLTYDHSSGTWYAMSTTCGGSTLYTVNVATPSRTVIGPMTGSAGCMISISADQCGNLYGYDIIDDSFYSINKTTGAATLIGPLGFDANYAQDMDFDPETNTCYLGAFNLTTFTGELWTVNTSTGAGTKIGTTGYEHTAFGIPGVATCGMGGIPCEDITSFVGRCIGGGTKTLQFRVNLLNSTIWAGTDVTIDVDGTQYTSTIFSNGIHSRASFQISGVSVGDHTATLVDPDCGLVVHPTCAADGPNPDWDATEALFGDAQFSATVAPATTRILGNYPNPFNPSTTIRYVLGEDVNVSVKVYNMLGQEVATLVNGFQKAGEQSVVWHGTNNFGQAVSSGLYIYRVQAGSLVMTEKMMFMK